HPENIVFDAVKVELKVPAELVSTEAGSGLPLGEVNVIVFEAIPILPAELSASFPVTVNVLPHGTEVIELRVSTVECFGEILYMLPSLIDKTYRKPSVGPVFISVIPLK